MKTEFSNEIKYNALRQLSIIESKKKYFTLEDVQNTFNLDKYDSKTTINSFWKAGIIKRVLNYSMPYRYVITPKYKRLLIEGIKDERN